MKKRPKCKVKLTAEQINKLDAFYCAHVGEQEGGMYMLALEPIASAPFSQKQGTMNVYLFTKQEGAAVCIAADTMRKLVARGKL